MCRTLLRFIGRYFNVSFPDTMDTRSSTDRKIAWSIVCLCFKVLNGHKWDFKGVGIYDTTFMENSLVLVSAVIEVSFYSESLKWKEEV